MIATLRRTSVAQSAYDAEQVASWALSEMCLSKGDKRAACFAYGQPRAGLTRPFSRDPSRRVMFRSSSAKIFEPGSKSGQISGSGSGKNSGSDSGKFSGSNSGNFQAQIREKGSGSESVKKSRFRVGEMLRFRLRNGSVSDSGNFQVQFREKIQVQSREKVQVLSRGNAQVQCQEWLRFRFMFRIMFSIEVVFPSMIRRTWSQVVLVLGLLLSLSVPRRL